VGFFLGVALATFATPSPSTRLYQTVGVFSLVGSVYSLYLGYESSQIGAVCAMCLTIYACCFLLAGTAFVAAPRESGPLFADLPKIGSSTAFFTLAATFVLTVLFGQTFVSTPSQRIEAMARRDPDAPPPRPEQVAETVSYVAPRGEVALEGDEPLLGKPDARFQIVEFADFGCPHCAQAFPLLHQVVERNPDVSLRFRVFPLSGACNPALEGQERMEVCRAAMATQCANKQGKFWDYAGLVFANQRYLAQDADALLAEAAKASALDFDQFAACMSDPATLQEVTKDAVAGARLRLPGTPAFFVKGVQGDGYVEICTGPEGVMQAIAAARDGVQLPPPEAGACDDGHGH
jgi:protein-disulfide isomerase